MIIHDLKCEPKYYEMMLQGCKPWEVRYNDRDYHAGEIVVLREWEYGVYSGRFRTFKITYVLRNFYALKDGFVVLSLKPVI